MRSFTTGVSSPMMAAQYGTRLRRVAGCTVEEEIGYESNASAAKSQGVELSLQARPLKGLTAAAWVVWSDAELTQLFPVGAAYGQLGDQLPYNSRS